MAKQPRRTSTLGNIKMHRNHYRARYEIDGQAHTPGRTFPSFQLADQWLTAEQLLIARDEWTPPAQRRAKDASTKEMSRITLRELAEDWIEHRTSPRGGPLSPRTVKEYTAYLNGLLASFACRPLASITPGEVQGWWKDHEATPAYRRKAYAFMKSVLASAVRTETIATNPCRVENANRGTRAASKTVRDRVTLTLTPSHVRALADALPERYRALVLVLAWTGLRPGEAFGLRHSDVVPATRDGLPFWRLKINRAITDGTDDDGKNVRIVGIGKTLDSIRDVWLPPHVVPVLEHHLDEFAEPGRDGLVFPSSNPNVQYMTVQQLHGTTARVRTDRRGRKLRQATNFHAAKAAIGMPELTIYTLRHWARKMLRQAGLGDEATEQFLGHGIPGATGAYAVLDPELVWPVVVRCSELAGWTRPGASAAPTGLAIDARLLNAMTPDQLRAALATMDEQQLLAVVPQIRPETLASVLGHQTPDQNLVEAQK